ncbi:capsule assembly Wzi family protein [Roseivirga sp.]|uniref:capsule assembly Wzi family protein n=1 Tax=Roseivirga sp. TaxID=1964215 RepID=UPI003B8ADDD4
MVKFRLIIILIIGYSSTYAQEGANDSIKSVSHSLNVESGALISVRSELPFWVKGNNSNRFTDEFANSLYQIYSYNGNTKIIEGLRAQWNIETIFGVRETINGSIIQANGGIQTRFLSLNIGLTEEEFGLNDSTLSIGNLVYGNNARPIPKISLSTNGWKKPPLLGRVVSFRGYLAHGQFENNRYQSNAYLHQKYFYLRFSTISQRLSLIGGLNHNAQWGGNNLLNETSQPTGFINYARIFVGSSGGADALLTDQINALGNHLGSYDLRGSMKFKHFTLSNYWQFLWEDKSGLTPFNWRDGLMGISLDLNNSELINKLVFEIVRTNNQNAQKTADDGTPIFEPDNFLNNGVYKSGWSFQNVVIGNPIFLILNPESQSISRIKNSINALNIGVEGRVKGLHYKIKYTDFKNKGTKYEIITPTLRMKSVDIDINYQIDGYSRISGRMNYQNANFDGGNNLAFQISYSKSFNF